MSRSAAVLKRLLPALTLDARDRLQAEEFLCDWQSGDALDELCDDVLEHCQAAVTQVKRAHNASLTCAKLPLEIWCLVWSLLPDKDDLVRVTHVCSVWRTTATGYPALWTHVRFWTTVHADGDGKHDMCDCPVDEQLHNLDQAATWLSRSKAVPITMDVFVYPVFAEAKLARRLAKIVRPHARRITHLMCAFGDVSFFVDFMQRAKHLSSLLFLRMSRITCCDNELNTWPFSKLRLDELEVPLLQEFRGYYDFIWDIEDPLEAPAYPSLQRLRCDFQDPGMLFDCLRCCPRLVFLNSSMRDIPATALPSTSSGYDAGLAPELRELILDDMTPQWASLIAPLIRRPNLKDLTLRYYDCDDAALFSPFATLSGALHLVLLFDGDDISVIATDENSCTRRVEFSAVRGLAPRIPVLGRVWRYVSSTLSSLIIPWDLRAALLNTSLRALRLSRIRFDGVCIDTQSPPPTVAELTSLNTAGEAGRPLLPALSAVEFFGSDGQSLSSAAIDFAAALSDSVLSLTVNGAELV